MSKLSDALKLVDTGERMILMPGLRIDEVYEADSYILSGGKWQAAIYDLRATWACRTIFTDEEYSNLDCREFKIANAKRKLVEELFGEFRQPLHELRVHLMNRDTGAAEKMAQQIYKGMFDV